MCLESRVKYAAYRGWSGTLSVQLIVLYTRSPSKRLGQAPLDPLLMLLLVSAVPIVPSSRGVTH